MRGAAFPLALAWLDCPPGAAAGEARGNFVAVGTMLPAIELWDLDVLDATEPVMVLGGEEEGAPPAPPAPGKKAKKGKRAATLRAGSHTDAVLGVAWNGARARGMRRGAARCAREANLAHPRETPRPLARSRVPQRARVRVRRLHRQGTQRCAVARPRVPRRAVLALTHHARTTGLSAAPARCGTWRRARASTR